MVDLDYVRERLNATKLRFRIVRSSCGCGGSWAWVIENAETRDEGHISAGCVCHSIWSLVLRLS
jgi:hypothetical protein